MLPSGTKGKDRTTLGSTHDMGSSGSNPRSMAEEPEDCCFKPAKIPVLPGNPYDRFMGKKNCSFRHCIHRNGKALEKCNHIRQPAEHCPGIRKCRCSHFHTDLRVDRIPAQCLFSAHKIDIRAIAPLDCFLTHCLEYGHARTFGSFPH